MPLFSSNLGRVSLSHQSAIGDAIKKLLTHPLATLLSILTLSIALAIPGLFFLVQQTLHENENLLSRSSNLNIFIKLDTEQDKIESLANTLLNKPQVASINVISSDEALILFSQAMEMQDIGLSNENNPLPAVIEVTPKSASINALQTLADELKTHPIVDQLALDEEWAEKLKMLYRLLSTLTLLLSLLFASLLFMVMVNTLRLEIVRRQEEIEIIKLVGGTDGYIILPFIYYTILLALCGSAIALLIIYLSSHAISPLLTAMLPGPVTPLSSQFGQMFWIIPLVSLVLGCISALFAVKSGLKRIDLDY